MTASLAAAVDQVGSAQGARQDQGECQRHDEVAVTLALGAGRVVGGAARCADLGCCAYGRCS